MRGRHRHKYAAVLDYALRLAVWNGVHQWNMQSPRHLSGQRYLI